MPCDEEVVEQRDQQEELEERDSDSTQYNEKWDIVPDQVKAHDSEIAAEIKIAQELVDSQPEIECDETHSTRATFDRAVLFLKIENAWLWRFHAILMPVPTIGLGPEGSIDLYWKTPSWRLLVNIPAGTMAQATFYWDDFSRQKTKGSFEPHSTSSAVSACLMK